MKYYKVVEVRNKKLYSAFTNHFKNCLRAAILKKQGIRYYVNKWVYPKKNAKQALFVFSDYETACSWAIVHGAFCTRILRIYECEIGKVLVESKNIINSFNNNMNEIMANITNIAGYKPANCVLVDKVKLIKRIE